MSIAIEQFSSQQTCEAAGNAAKRLAVPSRKNTSYVCVKS
jgi:hypothetical protein